jgi:hypothetical protein
MGSGLQMELMMTSWAQHIMRLQFCIESRLTLDPLRTSDRELFGLVLLIGLLC